MAYILKLTNSDHEICINFPKLDLAEIIEEIPEFKEMGVEKFFSMMYRFVDTFTKTCHLIRNFTIQTVAFSLFKYYLTENNLPVPEFQFFDLKFFDEFSSHDRFATRKVLNILDNSFCPSASWDKSEWQSLAFFGAMIEVLKPQYPGNALFIFDVGYLSSHIFGAFLAMVKKSKNSNDKSDIKVRIPSVERYLLCFSNGEQLPEPYLSNVVSVEPVQWCSNEKKKPIQLSMGTRKVLNAHFDRFGHCTNEMAKIFARQLQMDISRVRRYFVNKRSHINSKEKKKREAQKKSDEALQITQVAAGDQNNPIQLD